MVTKTTAPRPTGASPSMLIDMRAADFNGIRTRALKLTMPELARALTVTVQAVQNWDSGRQCPPGPVQVIMSAAADIPALRARLRRLAKTKESET